MADALVELRGIRKEYAGIVAVDSVDLSIASGEFVVLLGPSGSGKTTILSMLGGFVDPTSGSVLIDGRDVTTSPPARRPTVTVFQDYALFPHMRVEANVGFGLAMRKVEKVERERRVAEALRLVGLEGFGPRRVHQLSGGQRQRVALARAIAVEPTVLLLDEPLGALDLNLRRQMQDELVGLQKQLGTTFVHVTHDQDEAMSIADTIVVLNRGRIEDRGPPDRVYLRPATLFAATFMGESNIIEARVVGRSARGVRVDAWFGSEELDRHGDASVHDGAGVHLSVRPEQVRLAAPAEGPGDGSRSGAPSQCISLGRARVEETVFQGANRRCVLSVEAAGGGRLRARIPVEQPVHRGDVVDLYVRRGDVVLLED